MDADDYVPRILEDDSYIHRATADSSKWAAVHDALENSTSPSRGSHTSSLFTMAWVLGITLGLIWVMRNGRSVFSQWQENVYRRANRRRHGIPDDDDRPFNVAYAAAALARKTREQEEKERRDKARREYLQSRSELEKHGENGDMRQRRTEGIDISSQRPQPLFVQGNSTNPIDNRNGRHTASSTTDPRMRSRPQSVGPPHSSQPHHRSDPYNPNWIRDHSQSSTQFHTRKPPSRSASVDAKSRRYLDVNGADHVPPERRKHHHMDDIEDVEDRTTKRTRVDGEEFIDGENDAAWATGGSRRGSLPAIKRGSKRQANLEEDDEWEMSLDKRARKASLAFPDKGSDVEDIDDVDMARNSSDADSGAARGTKRDRDSDSAADSPAHDSDDSHKHRPSRKRRAASNGDTKGTDAEQLSRGRKRDRSHQKPVIGGEEGDESDASHKHGRRRGPQREAVKGTTPAEASESDDPACGGRRLGEVWEVNGQSFKVGLDGRRLRHALIRQRRSKFPMPKDSAHNDAKTNVDVVVEKWLNDEEYNSAKENCELAWQDISPFGSPNKAGGPKTNGPPVSGGKRLLWGGPPPSPIKGRTSIRATSTVQNPFDLAPTNAGRRVTSTHLLINSPAESPKLRSAKSFSKWEKQELEANSLKKMRARIEKEKKEKEKEQQKEKDSEKAKVGLPSNPAPTPLAPTTNTQAQPPLLAPPTLDAKPVSAPVVPSPNFFAKPAPAASSGSTPSFSFPKPPAAPSAISASTAAAAQPSNPSTFSLPAQFPVFPQTTQVPQAVKPSFSFGPAPGATPSPSEHNKDTTSKPSFNFGHTPPAPSTPAAPTTSKPSFNFSPPAAQPNQSSAPKAPSFSFAPSSVSSTPSGEPSKAPFSNPFAKPTEAQPASAPVAGLPFNFGAKPQPSAQNTAQKPPGFQFGPFSNGTPSGNAGGPNSGSLLNRLQPNVTSQPAQTPPAQAGWSPQANNPAQPPKNIFGQNQLQSQQETSKSPFAPPELPKNPFGQPSSTTTPPVFSFPKPSGTPDPTKPTAPVTFGKPEASTPQSKPPFSFNFTSAGNTGASTASPNANPFQPAAPSTGAQTAPNNLFSFGQPSSSAAPSAPNPNLFGFTNNSTSKK